MPKTQSDVIAVGFDFHNKVLRKFAKHPGIRQLCAIRAEHLLSKGKFPSAILVLVSQCVNQDNLGQQLKKQAQTSQARYQVATDDADAAQWLLPFFSEVQGDQADSNKAKSAKAGQQMEHAQDPYYSSAVLLAWTQRAAKERVLEGYYGNYSSGSTLGQEHHPFSPIRKQRVAGSEES